ncbi:efflux transporter outer membrane subunit [Haloferula rosea]|uniref:Efflux transporter outer membrane subunit n=1 Tax=Haloferula rosea TaxID=490093 RepID=A0A934R952_9BACT|nr:efflux transporter outer membrane subunit [Haloferula rosea]MBK1826253.1 efflux transporter outer membrane subunit [Haloferula rosea]
MKQAAGLALIGALLAGCATLPPDSRMGQGGSAPGAWTATKAGKAGIDDQWVDRFGSRDLQALVAEAYASNRNLQAAAARVERASAVARGAGVAARPQLNAAVNGSRDKRNFIGFPGGGGGGNISNAYGASLNLQWEIDLWGKLRAGEEASLADLQAEGYTYRGARASLAAQVVRGWLLLAESNEQIELAENALKVRKDTAELIRSRFELAAEDAGANASQLRLAETDVATAEAALAQRQGDRDQAQRQLEILLGRYPSAEITGSAKLPKVPKFPPAGLPSELLLRRPDILTAERRLAAAGRREDEARLAFYPSFSLTGSGGSSTEQLRNIFDSSFGVWSIAGQATQPILNGGALRSQLDTRTAEEKEALSNLQQTVLSGFGEVETALAADRFLAERERATGEALRIAVDGAESSAVDFGLGTGDVLTLLASQNRQIELAAQQLTLRRLRLDNRVNLHLALGGDYKISK